MFLLLATLQLGADLLGLVDERSRCGRIKSAAERVNLVDEGVQLMPSGGRIPPVEGVACGVERGGQGLPLSRVQLGKALHLRDQCRQGRRCACCTMRLDLGRAQRRVVHRELISKSEWIEVEVKDSNSITKSEQARA